MFIMNEKLITSKWIRKRKEIHEITACIAIIIAYMNKTNFNHHITGNRGRTEKGTRCTTVVAGSKRATICLIGAMHNLGLIHQEKSMQNMNHTCTVWVMLGGGKKLKECNLIEW